VVADWLDEVLVTDGRLVTDEVGTIFVDKIVLIITVVVGVVIEVIGEVRFKFVVWVVADGAIEGSICATSVVVSSLSGFRVVDGTSVLVAFDNSAVVDDCVVGIGSPVVASVDASVEFTTVAVVVDSTVVTVLTVAGVDELVSV